MLPSRLRSLLPAPHCMECTVWPTCKRTAFDRRMQCAVDDELSVQLLAADQNLRDLHEAKFRIFLASTARQLNLPDDNWQILGVPISTRSNAWRCRPTAASLSRLWESPYRMINSLQLTPCSTTRYRRPRYCQRCECSLVRHSRPSSVCSDQGVQHAEALFGETDLGRSEQARQGALGAASTVRGVRIATAV